MRETNATEITRSCSLLWENAKLSHFNKVIQPKAAHFRDWATVKRVWGRATVQKQNLHRNLWLQHQVLTVFVTDEVNKFFNSSFLP